MDREEFDKWLKEQVSDIGVETVKKSEKDEFINLVVQMVEDTLDGYRDLVKGGLPEQVAQQLILQTLVTLLENGMKER